MDEIDRRLLLGTAGLAGLALVAGRAKAGPLTPPAGPVGSTGHTTDQLWNKTARTDDGLAEARLPLSANNTPGSATSVYRIGLRGSYYLTTHVIGVSGKAGIEIAVDGVTLDLNGYSLIGTSGATEAITVPNGITPALSGLRISNGHVRGWTGGLKLQNASSVLLRELVVVGCGQCSVAENSIVESCVFDASTNVALVVGSYSSVRNCVFRGGANIGLESNNGCIVEQCAAYNNADDGFSGNGTTYRGCRASSNGSFGFASLTDGMLIDCYAASNTDGGIQVGLAGMASRCVAEANGGWGITVSSGSQISECLASGQLGVAAAGFRISGSDSRIENCNSVGNTIGYATTSNGSLFMGNTASGNTTNFAIGSGNFGLFVNAAPMVASANGLSGGNSVGTTDPRANLSF